MGWVDGYRGFEEFEGGEGGTGPGVGSEDVGEGAGEEGCFGAEAVVD